MVPLSAGGGGGDDAQECKEHAHSQLAYSFYNRNIQHTEVPEVLFVQRRECLVLKISWQTPFLNLPLGCLKPLTIQRPCQVMSGRKALLYPCPEKAKRPKGRSPVTLESATAILRAGIITPEC